MRISLYDQQIQKSLTLRPYMTQEFGNTSITVISISKPTYDLLKSRFAVSEKEAMVIPENYNLPV